MNNIIKLRNSNPKSDANILSKLMFGWIIKICYKCLKESLQIFDLYECLQSDQSDKLCGVLEKNWESEEKLSCQNNGNPSLLRAIQKTIFWNYMFYGFLLLFLSVFLKPMQPVLLSIFVSYFAENATIDVNEMYKYAGFLLLLNLLIIFFNHHLNLVFIRIGMKVRIACCSLIYRKMLRLSNKSLNQSAAGHLVNLLSNDVTRFDFVFSSLHYIWIIPIQTVVVTYLIWQQVQIAGLIGVGFIIILTIPVHAYVGKLLSQQRLKTAKTTDIRIKKMTEIVSGIQVIKMYAWEKPFAKIVDVTRRNEINILKWTSYLRGSILGSYIFVERATLFVTLISYVLLENVITADKVFSLLQFFNILQFSMAIHYFLATSNGAETLVSIKRLQKFLLLEERPNFIANNSSKNISVNGIDASWVDGTKILKNINLNVLTGNLCVIVGSVGAGKSSLLHILLGELILEKGSVEMGKDISYASQEPWLFASTVRTNILFGLNYDSKLYHDVIRVCALETDFKLLPHGDMTVIGDRGVSLSGGQKARINLARAIYRNADIYLLDDPLSAVDTHVGKYLFEECILGYLQNKTRILVTHQLQYLKKADHVVVINNGTIETQGTYAELSNCNLNITTFLTKDDEKNDSKEPVSLLKRDSLRLSLSNKSTESEFDDVRNNNEENIASSEGVYAYWQYARAGGNVCVILGLGFLIIFAQIVSNGSDYWIAYWTRQETLRFQCNNTIENNITLLDLSLIESHGIIKDLYYTNQNESQIILTLTNELTDCDDVISSNVAIYIYAVLIIGCIVTLIIRSLYFYNIAMHASQNLHNNMFYSLLKTSMRFFDVNPNGRILNRFSSDMGIIDEMLPREMLEALQIFAVAAGILIMVFITNVYLIAIAIALMLCFYKLSIWYIRIARNIKHLEGIARSPVFSHITSSLNGLTTIRSSLKESLLIKEFDEHQNVHTAAWHLLITIVTAFGLWLDLLSFLFVAFVAIGGVIMKQFSSMDASMIGLAVSQSLILTGMVQYGLQRAANVVSYMTSIDRILEYCKLDKEEPQETPQDKIPPQSWPSRGAIKFQQVYLRYSQSEPPVLKNLNFIVEPSEKIGIVGRTGVGKSSLISALFRLVEVEGTILIDDINTDGIGLNDLRKKISIIPQEPVLFSATLRYNLDPFEDFSDNELWNALEEVELKDIAQSLDFIVQDSGSNFSVGQRQLVCLARAILRNNKILILDEATANVDLKTDALIQRTIRRKFSTCTVLTVAHRLNTIMDSDKVLVMHAGTLVEYDHPYQLLQNTKGYFYHMVTQTGVNMTIHLQDIAKTAYLKNRKEKEEISHL